MSLPKSIRIAVIDDHRLFLDGITLLVGGMAANYEVVSFDTPIEILQQVDIGTDFDLVLCDLIMQPMNGLAFVAALRAKSELVPVLMLSGITSTPPIDELKQVGGSGFVHKSAANDELKLAIEALLSGQNFFSVEAENVQGSSSASVEPFPGQTEDTYKSKPHFPKLGNRQVEVLSLIANGATNRDISQALSISENTVKSHLKSIFQELGVNKRTACVRKAQTLGLI